MALPDGGVPELERRELLVRAGVFVLTVVLVVAAAATFPYVAPGGPEPREYPEFEPSSVVPDRAPIGGNPQPTVAADSGVVVIDYSHANRFEREEVQPLVAAITAAGYRAEFAVGGDLEAVLGRADAYVVIDPGRRFSEAEVDEVESFVRNGGRVLMLGEPTRSRIAGFAIVSVTNRMAPLSTRFGIEFGSGYLFNMERHEGTFQNVYAAPQGETALTDGVERSAMYTAAPVEARGGTPLLVALEGTRSVRNDVPGAYSLAVLGASGNVLAVGDTTFLARENFNVVDNDAFVANVAEFLVSAERERTLEDYPYNVEADPTIRYTSVELLEPAQQIAGDFRSRGDRPTLRLERGAISAENTDILITTFEDLRTQQISGPGTGITVRGSRVAVDGYESSATGITVIRSPRRGIDVVIAADSTIEATEAADLLVDGRFEQHAISSSTVVVRNVPASEDDDGNASANLGG